MINILLTRLAEYFYTRPSVFYFILPSETVLMMTEYVPW